MIYQMFWIFSGCRLPSYLHLHVGADPVQNPLEPHVLLAEPCVACPSGQTYSITDDTLNVYGLAIVLFTLMSGLPQVVGAAHKKFVKINF